MEALQSKLTVDLVRLEKTSSNLVNNAQNSSARHEVIMNNSIMKALVRQGCEVGTIEGLPGGVIYKGTHKLVQWDGILLYTNNAIVPPRDVIVLVETKQNAHRNDIFGKPEDRDSIKKSLYSKALRTHEYFSAMAALSSSAKGSLSVKERVQLGVLTIALNADIAVVYASSVLEDDILSELRRLSEDEEVVARGIQVGFAVMDSSEDCSLRILNQ